VSEAKPDSLIAARRWAKKRNPIYHPNPDKPEKFLATEGTESTE
jgi:hypothetical protein